MQPNAQAAPVSKAALLVGRTISALMALFMLFDGGMKMLKLAPAVEGTVRLGYSVSLVFAIGIVDLICYCLCHAAYVYAWSDPDDRLLGWRDRDSGADTGSRVLVSGCDWCAPVGGALPAGCPAPGSDSVAKLVWPPGGRL